VISVYHGTTHLWKENIRETGLCPPPGHGPGVRVTRDHSEARRQARAWAAHYFVAGLHDPKGIIVSAYIPPRRLRNVRGVLRVEYLRPEEISIQELGQFTEVIRNLEARHDALDLFEELTSRGLHPTGPRTRVRRS